VHLRVRELLLAPALPSTLEREGDMARTDDGLLRWRLERLHRHYLASRNLTLLFDALDVCQRLDVCPRWLAQELVNLGGALFVPPKKGQGRRGRARGTWRQEHWENLKHIARANLIEGMLNAGYSRVDGFRLATEYFAGTRAKGGESAMIASFRKVVRGRKDNPAAWGVLSRFDEEYIAREYEPPKERRQTFYAGLPTNQRPPDLPNNATPREVRAYHRWRQVERRRDARRQARRLEMFALPEQDKKGTDIPTLLWRVVDS
jgi:hypothetical protein